MLSRVLTFAACALASLVLVAPADASAKVGRHGRVGGGWDLPAAGQPGHARGVLFNEDALPVLELTALIREHASLGVPGRRGGLAGVLETLPDATGFQQTIAIVRGRWIADPHGDGYYEAVFLQPNGLGGLRVIGGMRGAFDDDPPGPPNTVGHFKGKWAAH